jgi:hypothetical protein
MKRIRHHLLILIDSGWLLDKETLAGLIRNYEADKKVQEILFPCCIFHSLFCVMVQHLYKGQRLNRKRSSKVSMQRFLQNQGGNDRFHN